MEYNNVFVTGGSGFLGQQFIKYLKDECKINNINAIARSENSANKIKKLGANVIIGDLHSIDALEQACKGVDVVFHLAACTDLSLNYEQFRDINVNGTLNVLKAAKKQGVKKFIHCGTEAGFAPNLLNLNDETPLPDFNKMPNYLMYSKSKNEAEVVVRNFNCDELTTVVIRPRWIWGEGDEVILPKLLEAIKTGQMKWIDGANYKTNITHVINVCEGLWCGALNGKGGEGYFVTDGKPMRYKDVVIAQAEACDVDATNLSNIPRWLIMCAAGVMEFCYNYCCGSPPLITRQGVVLIGNACEIDDSRARKEIGYKGKVTFEEGIRGLREWYLKKNKNYGTTSS